MSRGQVKGSKAHRVLMTLKTNGKATNWELNKICFRYGAIIHDLRKEGHTIVTNRINNDGLYEYVYKGHEEPVNRKKFLGMF